MTSCCASPTSSPRWFRLANRSTSSRSWRSSSASCRAASPRLPCPSRRSSTSQLCRSRRSLDA
uniref:Uncharacterized protein n=1 Tax=Arundo donax TaxID=35708 RepID=A0A0A9FYJ5_ARUDO